jgi:hypothetical protein
MNALASSYFLNGIMHPPSNNLDPAFLSCGTISYPLSLSLKRKWDRPSSSGTYIHYTCVCEEEILVPGITFPAVSSCKIRDLVHYPPPPFLYVAIGILQLWTCDAVKAESIRLFCLGKGSSQVGPGPWKDRKSGTNHFNFLLLTFIQGHRNNPLP